MRTTTSIEFFCHVSEVVPIEPTSVDLILGIGRRARISFSTGDRTLSFETAEGLCTRLEDICHRGGEAVLELALTFKDGVVIAEDSVIVDAHAWPDSLLWNRERAEVVSGSKLIATLLRRAA